MDIFTLTPFEIEAIKLSLLVGVSSVIIILPFGLLFGYILAKKDFFGKSLFDSILHLPLVMPPVVVGYLLLLLFGNKGLIGEPLKQIFGISFAFNWKGAALASAVMAFPLMVRSIRLSIEAIDNGLEDAAKTLGASRIRVFLTITLPLAIPGVIAGIILAFARSLGEFGATITFVSNIPSETRTLPLALYSALQMPNGEPQAIKLCIISAIIAILALIISEYFTKLSKKA